MSRIKISENINNIGNISVYLISFKIRDLGAINLCYKSINLE